MFKRIKKKLEIGGILKWLLTLSTLVLMNNIADFSIPVSQKLSETAFVVPFGAALYFAAVMAEGATNSASKSPARGLASLAAAYLLSIIPRMNFSLLAAVSAEIIITTVAASAFSKRRRGAYLLVFLPASLIPYIFLGGQAQYLARFASVAAITLVGAAIFPAAVGYKVRGLRRLDPAEAFGVAVLYTAAMIGGIKYVGSDIYRGFALFLLMFAGAVFGGKESCLVALVLALPAAIYLKSPIPFAPYLMFGALTFAFGSVGRETKARAIGSRVVYSLAMLSAELASAYLFGWYGDYSYVSLIPAAVGILLAALVPERLIRRASESLSLASDMPLSRYEINRTRSLVSGRLYEISGTFREIAELFRGIKERDDPFLYEDAIIDEVDKVCAACPLAKDCRAGNFPTREDVVRLVSIARGKGKLSSVDLPKRFSDRCGESGKVMFAINKYVALYTCEIDKKHAEEETREMVGIQADGVAMALKGMARTLSKSLSYRTARERKLAVFLLKKGVNLQEAMIFGEGESTEVHLILGRDDERLNAALNEFFKAKMCEAESFDLPGGRKAKVYERAAKYECMFGVSTRRKEGESASGDAHTLIKISKERYLLALSDGMGSGDGARSYSATAMSLIECFYRAGLPGETALGTANKLLGFAGEENFAALDLAVIDLGALTCDFIKLGAPYGFILSEGNVRLIEGSSLPLGILKEVRPAVCTQQVSVGDVIVFASDGVTDAFGSASDFAEFLTSASLSNPQRLSERILGEAVSLGGPSDDMTVVACKIFSA